MPGPPTGNPDLDDTFINVWFDKEQDGSPLKGHKGGKGEFYDQWIDKASAKHSSPELFGADALRQLYPNHSLVMSAHYSLNLLNFPGAYAVPMEKTPLVTNVVFVPLARRLGSKPGVLVDQVEFGAFTLGWEKFDFIVYIAKWTVGYATQTQYFILHEGPEDPARALLLTAGLWSDQIHDEIWVFNQGFWQKDHGLWTEVQKADWKDVILKDQFKKALQKDVYGFFTSEDIYKQLGIPWKRGLILYGPPGNGKTISIKTIMKTCDAQGFAPLYVKSFQSYKGEEGAMADVFDKARQMSPCVLVFEDLDSLINDKNRSFFLNQLDGLEGNDGLLVIGTTNHFERLDPGLSTRPSRFDRKYLFDDPDREERALYARYWQNKLKDNKEISFPESLVDEVAGATEQFSFAYLKEAFVSTLVTLAGYGGDDKPSFATALRSQIKSLRRQLDKNPKNNVYAPSSELRPQGNMPVRPQPVDNSRDVRVLLDALSDSLARSDIRPTRIFETGSYPQPEGRSGRDVRVLLDALSNSIARSDTRSSRIFDAYTHPSPSHGSSPSHINGEGRDFRVLLDGINSQRDHEILSDRVYQSHLPAAGSGTGNSPPWDRGLPSDAFNVPRFPRRDGPSSSDLGKDVEQGRIYGPDLA